MGGIAFHINTDLLLTALCALMCTVMSICELYGFLAFLVPLASTFNAPYIWIASLIVLLFRKKKLYILTLFMWIVITGQELNAHYLYGVSDTNRMIGYISTIALLIYLVNDSDKRINYVCCLKRFVLGVSVLFILYTFNVYTELGTRFVGELMLGSVRFGGTASDTFSTLDIPLNANTIAYYSIIAIACILTLCKTEKSKNIKIYYGLAFIECAFIGALTISRSWFIVAFICGFIYMLSCSTSMISFLKHSVFWVAFLVIALFLLSTKTTIIDSFLLRFNSENIETAGGRTLITSQYLESFWNNMEFFFLGSGVTDYTVVME